MHIGKAVRQCYKGRVRLGMQTRRSVYLAPVLMEAFALRYPDVELVIRDGIHQDLVEMCENNEVDLLFSSRVEEQHEMEYIKISDEYVVLMVPKDHPANQFAYARAGDDYSHIDLKHFDQETFILPQKSQSLCAVASEILKKEGVNPGRILEIKSIEASNSMVAKGLGVGFNRSGYVEFSKNKDVRYYLVGEEAVKYPLEVQYKKGKEITPYMQYVIDLLREL